MAELREYRVRLYEHKGDTVTIFFYCMADDREHAAEQALNAYPDGRVMTVLKV
jgi:hypothetical protein